MKMNECHGEGKSRKALNNTCIKHAIQMNMNTDIKTCFP